MKQVFVLILLCTYTLGYAQKKGGKKQVQINVPLSQKVNPFIGTGGHGHTFPGPTMPFGACQLSPDTRLTGWDGCSGYHYSDSVIYGFSHTHLSGTGCSDYGDILLMPTTKEVAMNNYQYASHFSHNNERAHAGYYQVKLDDPGINVELSATLHGGVHHYTYPMGSDMYVVLDLKHRDEVLDCFMEQLDDYTVRGYRFSKAWAQNQKVYFEIRFSSKINHIIYEPVKVGSNTTAVPLEKSKHCLIQLENPFKQQSSIRPSLLVKCAISGVDLEGAHKNLLKELNGDSFSDYRNACEAEWNKELSKIKMNTIQPLATGKMGMSTDKQTTFYTALYHCMIHPSLYSDVDGRYRGRDDKIHSTEGKFDYYTVFSLWDTYRSLHPLLSIIDKKRTNDFIQTFIKQYEHHGRLPIWELSSNETNCMIGYHVVSVIWDAYNKGIRDYDVNKAYEAMTKIATHSSDYEGTGMNLKLKKEARGGAADADALESYNTYGFVRSDDSHESVSKTLEFAYDDWCIAQMAKALGKSKDYGYYIKRSQYWKNVYDPSTGFMRARNNGCLNQPFSPYTVDNNYTEANAWQYSFYVPHQVDELILMEKGNMNFEKNLDNLFNAKTQTQGREQADITGLIGQYAHGNEPSHHIAYLYHLIGKPAKGNKIIQKIMNEFYTNKPDGLIGNEDCGQMSAWYVLSAMGVYQVCPGTIDYLLSDSTKLIQFSLLNQSYSQSKSLYNHRMENGISAENKFKVTTFHPTAMDKSVFDMDASGMDKGNLGIVPSPYILATNRIFKDELTLSFASVSPKNKLHYSLNATAFTSYQKPFTIKSNTQIQFYAENTSGERSPVQVAGFTQLPKDRKIILKNEFNKSYHAGGADGLMDGIYGKLNWRAGDWQGYQGQDVEIIMAFNESRPIQRMAANFLEDQNAWIFYPKSVSFYVGNDTSHWTLIEDIPTNKSDHNLEVSISKFASNVANIPASKYVKLVVHNFGPMPEWHEGRGNPTFIFIDEFEVE